MSTLYELTDEFRQVLDMASDPEIDPQVIADTLEAIGGEIGYKADGYGKVIRQLEADVLTLRMEEERLARRRRTIDANIDRMKKNLQQAMTATGQKNIDTKLFKFTIRKNPASVVIDDEAKIPLRFLIAQPPKIDKAAIKKELKETSRPWAHLESTESLMIR